MVGYFMKIFRSQGTLQNALHEVTDTVVLKVTLEMNVDLLKPYTDDEIKVVLIQMHPSKALGSDGMSPLFYQQFWHIVESDVVVAVWSFLSSSCLLHETCFTHVVLAMH